MELLQTILLTVLTLGVLITVHEFGHFWVARRCGVKVLKFSIGFGPSLVEWRDRYDTVYALALIPLGGFVRMVDEREGDVPESQLQYAFNRKSVGQRFAIVAAGPIANLLLAILAYWIVFVSGVSGVTPIIAKVDAGSIAEIAGLSPGQELVAIDGEATPTRQAVAMRLLRRLGDTGSIEFSAKYPNKPEIYDSKADVQRWLVGEVEPDLVGGLGLQFYEPTVEAVVEQVVDNSPAAKAGIKANDKLIEADGKKITDWLAWVDYVRSRPEQRISLLVLRDSQTIPMALIPERKTDEQGKAFGQVGVQVKMPEWPKTMIREFHYGPIEALSASLERTATMSMFTLESIKKMLEGLISPKNLSGPITIAKVAAASAKSGFEAYLEFLALLSISLGVLNLLPIPVLDGGHLFFYAVEWLTGRPLPQKVQEFGLQIGVVIIAAVMMLAIYNDLMRL
jgi:regulator of sigma E protease